MRAGSQGSPVRGARSAGRRPDLDGPPARATMPPRRGRGAIHACSATRDRRAPHSTDAPSPSDWPSCRCLTGPWRRGRLRGRFGRRTRSPTTRSSLPQQSHALRGDLRSPRADRDAWSDGAMDDRWLTRRSSRCPKARAPTFPPAGACAFRALRSPRPSARYGRCRRTIRHPTVRRGECRIGERLSENRGCPTGFGDYRYGSRFRWLSAWADVVDAAVVGRVAA